MAPARTASLGLSPGANAIEDFQRAVDAGASAFLSPSEERAAAARDAARALFSRLSSSVAADGLELPLPALHTDGLDAEQVWQQIEMQLEPLLVKAKRALKRLKPTIEADDDLSAARLFTLPASMAAEQEEEGEGVEWEPFDEGVEYDVDGDEEADASEGETESSEGEEEEKDDREDGVRREDTSSADVTAKYFKNPGMFSLTEMENFALQAEKAEEKRLRIEALREEKRAAGVAGDDGSESESEDDPILEAGGSDSGSDSDDDGSESSSEDEEMDELLGNTARLAGVDPARRASNKRGSKAAREKKGKDIMFEDFFGQAPNAGKKKGLSGMKGLEADELSEEEEDIFNEMERGEMEGDDDDDEEEEDGGLEDEDALRKELEQELADELAVDEEEDDDDGAFRVPDEEAGADEANDGFQGPSKDAVEEDEEDAAAAVAAALARRADYIPSAFQRAQAKLARQIKTLEERALQEKTWLLKGEASAKDRPKNSVLEADVEFDHAQAPPPTVSEEMTARLEDVIKARIAEQRFDDVERVEPMLDSLSNRGGRKGPELDDQKSKRGLGDVYADEFVKQREAAAGRVSAVEEKEEPLAAEARALFKALNVKLDALSHFHFTPKPIVEDIAVKVDAPALEVEEVAPAMASEASRKAPEEVFAGGGGAGGTRGSAAGAVKADGELTKEDRKASRAKRKRKAKAVGQERERIKTKKARAAEEKEKAAEEAGFARKVPKVSMLAAAPAGGRAKSDFSKSSKVFSMLQEAKDADAAGLGGKKSKSNGVKNKSALKL